LGAEKAQSLARQFGLAGRVDLYHAFAIAMTSVLRPGGVMGLLTSNRFLTIKSGATLRKILRDSFDLKCVYDLGDTKLFSAAVLPVIVVGNRQSSGDNDGCQFDRVYEIRGDESVPTVKCDSVLDALEQKDVVGAITTPDGRFLVERGHLRLASHDATWALHTPATGRWLSQVIANRECVFDDVAHIRVGIKTTADDVFIRDDWSALPIDQQPEGDVLRPLITHNCAARWRAGAPPDKVILYPHVSVDGKRKPVDLVDCPRARAYLESHGPRLKSRDYVIEAGRKWYEIWVPHNPDDWSKPKIVYPDISERPTFFLDRSGALVNGDCYWITLRQGVHEDWLYLMLAIANSTFATQYYDTVFHNKLYAGRRRFMTQYVKNFPIPNLKSEVAQEIVACTKDLLKQRGDAEALENGLNALVVRSFGLTEEVVRKR
jgi:adenine-specific DNA-methyltransferase